MFRSQLFGGGQVGDLEKEGYASNEIVIGGFSQGGAMALQAVLRCHLRIPFPFFFYT